MDTSSAQAILVVDDNEDNAEIVRALLESRGFSVIVAHDGDEALALFESARPPLVLLDVLDAGAQRLGSLPAHAATSRARPHRAHHHAHGALRLERQAVGDPDGRRRLHHEAGRSRRSRIACPAKSRARDSALMTPAPRAFLLADQRRRSARGGGRGAAARRRVRATRRAASRGDRRARLRARDRRGDGRSIAAARDRRARERASHSGHPRRRRRRRLPPRDRVPRR